MSISIPDWEKESILEKEWVHCGLRCKVIFVYQSHRCGYVGLYKSHVAYGIKYDNINVDVHGGLTFGNNGKDNDFLDDKETYWLGFDCGHGGDTPFKWTLDVTIVETNRLAEKLSQITSLYTVLDYEVRRFLYTYDNELISKLAQEAKLRKVAEEI
jgi:hypothetical protein